jgi:hypothetical protein
MNRTIRISFGGGIGIGGVIFTVFLVLKILGEEPVASWSWLWVLSPLWIPVGVAIAFITFLAFITLCLAMVGTLLSWRTRQARLRAMMRDDT